MIELQNLTLRRGSKILLDSCSVKINPREKIALVGKNGAGKSSLFALFTGDLAEDSGIFNLPKNWQIAEVSQELPNTNISITDFVLSGDANLVKLQNELVDLLAIDDVNSGLKIAQLHADLADAGAHDALSRAQSLILGLGFSKNDLLKGVNSFSGGWRMRLQLARALMCPSDLLLLDEPTNHLDLDALVWLESWLKSYNGTLVIISHDRDFLDSVAASILHLENTKLTKYVGNYSQFERQLAQKIELQQSSYVKQQAKIAHLQSFIDRFQYKATKAKQAQSRIKQLEKMQKIAPVLAESTLTFSFKAAENLPNPMLSMQMCDLGYQQSVILQQVNRTVLPKQRIGILGANGQGKSTLIKSIAGQIPSLQGEMIFGKNLKIGYFAQQELDVLDMEQTPLQHLISFYKDKSPTEQNIRSHLGSFGFSGDMVKQAIGSMSGGEKARLVFATIAFEQPNLLLLDEPTNHLDLAMRDTLSMVLNDFDGTVLLVSHDRSLLRSVCDEFWLVADGKVTEFTGDLADYENYIINRFKKCADDEEPNKHNQTTNKRRQNADARKQLNALLKPLKTKQNQLEQQLNQLKDEQTALQQYFNHHTHKDLAAISRRLHQIENDIELLEAAWFELEEQIEQLTANY